MIHAEGLRTFYLFTVIAVCCVFIVGCQKPTDVVCTDLSELINSEPIICTDGNETQLCMSPESDNCGYYVNSIYIPCRSSCDCDAAAEVAVAFCLGMSLTVDLSCTNQVADDTVAEKNEALLDAMEYLNEHY